MKFLLLLPACLLLSACYTTGTGTAPQQCAQKNHGQSVSKSCTCAHKCACGKQHKQGEPKQCNKHK